MADFYHDMINEVFVFLIDDDEEFVSEMIYLLESHEYKVRTVDTASQGMSMLSKGKENIDLMIINMNSPDLLSFQLLNQAITSDIVSICICDEYDTRSAKKAFENGAYFYLQKPLLHEYVKSMWQLVLQKNIQKVKVIDLDKQENDIHETTNGVVCNEKYKLKRKRGKKLIEEKKSESSATKVVIQQKTRIVWTDDLHSKFQEAVNKLNDGRCFPSDILEAMNVPGLTLYQIASHLQKYRNNTWKAPRKRKSTCHSSSQLGTSSGSSNLRIFETISHLKRNVTNLQQQETQRAPKTPFLPNNNIFSRGESSSLQKVYHPQLQVDPQYFNPFDTPLLSSSENNNVVGLQQHEKPLSESWGLQGSNIGTAEYTPGLKFNEINHAQNNYALDVEKYSTMFDTNITNPTINELVAANIDFQQYIGELQGSNIESADYTPGLKFNNGIPHAQNDYALDVASYATLPNTNIANPTIDGLSVANIGFEQHIDEQNMVQPLNNVVTTSHMSGTQESEPSEMMNCDEFFDFDNMDFFFQNDEPPSFDLSNELDSAFDQAYSDDMATSSAQFPDITSFLDDSST
nr:putative two-component response regulator ARR20 [Solanum lycopersicum]